MRSLFQFLFATVLVVSVGCGPAEFHTLEGQVELQGTPEFTFSGDVLELRLQGDHLQRAFGEIKPDGSFHVETLHDGKITRGVRPGVYEGRIVLSDDDPQHIQRATKVIHRRFTRFETSDIRLKVPAENVVLHLTAK